MKKVDELRKMSKPEVYAYIRGILDSGKRVRFEMSGYNLNDGSCVSVFNQSIIDRFAFLGIYDYFKFLHIDFYKGIGELYFRTWDITEGFEEVNVGGYGTADIIYFIFTRSILTDNKIRRRTW